MESRITSLDLKIIASAKQSFVPMARVAFFIIFFYFGFLKLLGVSPASSLAQSLTIQTIGLQYFDAAYTILALIECVIGILFLFPKATRVVIPVIFVHLAIVCSPLVLIPGEVFTMWFVPNLEGQYIIKNVVLVAAAIGIAANVMPLNKTK